jgi:hypothetical protein
MNIGFGGGYSVSETVDEKAALRTWAVERSVELFSGAAEGQRPTAFQVLAMADNLKAYVETGVRPR